MRNFKVAQIPFSRAVKRKFQHSKLKPFTVPINFLSKEVTSALEGLKASMGMDMGACHEEPTSPFFPKETVLASISRTHVM